LFEIESEPLGIDQNVVDAALKCVERLNAERNLRYEIDNIDTSVGKIFDLCSYKRWSIQTGINLF
jgi:hypothetical protein